MENLVDETSRLVIGPRPDRIRHLDADTLAEWLRECYELSAYENLRIASCYSGNGGELSFAARLSRATGKPVKGYIDEVTYPYESYGMTNLLRQNEANRTYEAFQDILAVNHSFRIKKTNPYNINDANYSRWAYQPVKFFPS